MAGDTDITISSLLDDLGPPSEESEERAAALVGRLISDRYRVEALLGQGGMGAVYRGEQIHLFKRVAIKVLHPEIERLAGLIERFEREAVAGAHVQHPNVAAAIDFGKLPDGSYFLVLEYIEGTLLSTVLEGGPLPPIRALRIARQMAAGLEAVHAMGIVHRDIKPRNTLLGPDDHVKIIDFGLAKVRIDHLPRASRRAAQNREAELTTSGVLFGTPPYLAPEASLGMARIDARSDLYALGVTLYEMLSGHRPFECTDQAELFLQQRIEDPPPFQVRAPEVAVPAEAEQVAIRLVQRAPRDRFQSASETIAAIDEAIEVIEARALANVIGPDQATVRVRRWALPALALGVLVTYLSMRTRPESHDTGPPLSSTAAPSSTSTAVAPHPSAEPAPVPTTPTEIDGLDAAGWRARLERAASVRDWVLGSHAFLALAQLDPGLLDDERTRARVIGVAAGIAHSGKGDLSDAVFDMLSTRLGTSGLDLLYDLATSRGGTRGAYLARDILLRPDVQPRESPALRIASEFLVASCETRRTLLDRAAEEGDRRTLMQLEVMHGFRCWNPKHPCCFRNDPAVAEALNRLRARVRSPSR